MTYPPYNGKKNIILESFFVWGYDPLSTLGENPTVTEFMLFSRESRNKIQ